MRSLGLNHLAPRIAANPNMAFVICLLVTFITGYLMLTQTQFTGDITENLKGNSDSYQNFLKLEQSFHPFSRDESLMIRTKDLSNPETFAKFQEFLLDLQFASQINTAFSIFSLPALPKAGNESQQPGFFLSQPHIKALPPKQQLSQLRQKIPLAAKLISQDHSVTMVLLILNQQNDGETAPLKPESRQEILDMAENYNGLFQLSFVGLPEIQRTVRSTLKQDQTRLTVISVLLCLTIAWLIFRSWRSAVICSIPPVISMVWYFGFLAIFSIPVDFLTTIIPTMIIVVAFADGLHLYLSIQRNQSRYPTLKQAITQAIKRTGPACFLASLTTAIAFIGIGLGGAETMHRLSYTGAVGILLAFTSVIFIMPTLASFLLKGGARKIADPPEFLSATSRPASYLVSNHHIKILVFSIFFSIALIFIHFNVPASFRVTDYLSNDVQIRKDEAVIDAKLTGSGQLYAIIKDPDGQQGLSKEDLETLTQIMASLNRKASTNIGEEAALGLLRQFNLAELANSEDKSPLLHHFVSRDFQNYLVPLPLSSMMTSKQISAYAEKIEAQLANDGFDNQVYLAGMSLLTAKETPVLISNLRTGLITAIVIVILVIMLVVGSVRIGLACLLPNLIPILTVESFFWISGQPITMTAVIALTIAFGIAVDNSIHMLNQYQLAKKVLSEEETGTAGSNRQQHEQNLAAITKAIKAITPAVVSTTLLLGSGLAMTQFSILPSVALFGRLVISALFVALLADLFILPSFLIAQEKKTE